MTATSLTAVPRTRRRGAIALLVLVVVAVALVVAVSRTGSNAGRYLATNSPSSTGALAITRLLEAQGTRVSETTSQAQIGPNATVLVLSPASYSAAQIRQIAQSTSGPVVLLAPDTSSLAALGVQVSADTPKPTSSSLLTVPPGCELPAIDGAGPVEFDPTAPTLHGADVTTCYGGRLVAASGSGGGSSGVVQALTDPTALENDRLADVGTAALDLDLLGTTASLTWLRPGTDAAGATGSVWDALPPGSGWAAFWAIVVGGLVVLWRGRRLGAPIAEPLPVAVRASEVVRGRGRLYARAGAHDHAAAVLRRATLDRLRRRLGLPVGSPATFVTQATSVALWRVGHRLPPGLLDGPAPADDDALMALATDLAELERRLDLPGTP